MTPTPEILAVAFYTGLNGLILLWLSVHVSRVRGDLGIMVGDDGNPAMIRAIRGQGNFIEYVPFALLQLLLIALLGAPWSVITLFGVALTLGRLLHGWHFTHDSAPAWQRMAGAGMTFLALLLMSLGLISHALFGVF